jgi:hypothetical protein
MKKWLEYQYKNQVKEWDWEYAKTPIVNINEKLESHSKYIIDGFKNETLKAEFQNVFIRPDYIKRTAATTNGEVTEDMFRAWLAEHLEFIAGIGHKYMTHFGDSHDAVYDVVSTGLGLDPATTRIRIQIEEPGHYFPMHLDRHKYQEWETEGDKEQYVYDKNADFHKHSIYITMLQDWQHGQAIQMGNNFLQWKAGDVYNWNFRNVPHGTANFGYETNYIMVITGNKINKG